MLIPQGTTKPSARMTAAVALFRCQIAYVRIAAKAGVTLKGFRNEFVDLSRFYHLPAATKNMTAVAHCMIVPVTLQLNTDVKRILHII